MNWNGIKYFIHVADVGSVSVATSELGIVQPALSRHIRRPEEEVGAKLFHRLPRGMHIHRTLSIVHRTGDLPPAVQAIIDVAQMEVRELAATGAFAAILDGRRGPAPAAQSGKRTAPAARKQSGRPESGELKHAIT